MYHGNKDRIFSVRCAPGLAEAAAKLAKRRGLHGRSTLVVTLIERELATEAAAGAEGNAQTEVKNNAEPT